MANPLLPLAAWMARILPPSVKRGLYRVKPLAGLIRMSLNRAAPQGITTVDVAGGGLAGWRLALDLQKEKDYWLGTYEPELQAAIADFVQPGAVVFDVGANIGYISLLLARRVGRAGRVYAFEALPANLERLRQNLVLNRVEGRVTIIPAAVMERTGPARFWLGPSGGMGKVAGSAGRREVTYDREITVPCLSLDEFVYAHQDLGEVFRDRPIDPLVPQVVKMDIEGGEVLALPGMRRLLREARPLVFLELHGPEAALAAWDELTAAGYRIARMQPGYPEAPTMEALDWKAYLVGLPER